jgi:hypothetical protein
MLWLFSGAQFKEKKEKKIEGKIQPGNDEVYFF